METDEDTEDEDEDASNEEDGGARAVTFEAAAPPAAGRVLGPAFEQADIPQAFSHFSYCPPCTAGKSVSMSISDGRM